MNSITIYHNNRRIILWEKTLELEIKVDSLEVEEPFLHKCNDRMSTILEMFFKRENIQEISFEHYDFEKLVNDFKSHFKYIEAAGGVVRNSKNELLVIQRLGKPDLPKGKIEQGENAMEAAIREVEEECGINDLELLSEAKPSYHIYLHNNKRILKKTFWFKMKYAGNEVLVPQTEEDITDVEWCNALKLEKSKKETYQSLKAFFELTN